MIILGVWDGTPSSAALIIDGKIINAVTEERLNRSKNAYGFPAKSIQSILRQTGYKLSDIDEVAMTTASLSPTYFYTSRNATFSIKDYWREQNYYWYKKFYKGEDPQYLKIFKDKINHNSFPYDKNLIKDEKDSAGMWNARKKHLSETLGIDEKKISLHDHHSCHACYGYLMSPYRKKKSLIFTMDGNGDNTNGTISYANPGENLSFISRSSNFNLGRIYRYTTLLLGMRPADHEYKVMGLAAYNNEKYGKEAYEIYKNTLQVDGLTFKYKTKIKDHFFYFKEKLEGQRFDAIAYGVQRFTEEILTDWIKYGIQHSGISNVIMSGGVAQNIKANKCISELKELDQLFIPPGPGDESLCIGAAWLQFLRKGGKVSDIPIYTNAYFGPSFTSKEIEIELEGIDLNNFEIKKVEVKEIAKLISTGEVIARFSKDPMEFGARALGNRSILADPRKQTTINYINKLVKMRDFWMPFAPSILEERQNDYIVNPKKIDARYMAIGFESTLLAKNHLVAGLHPFDKTMRPQIVNPRDNYSYYSLIKEFENITGVGALLNTSFNIHGEPIVGSPGDAIDTLKRCGLKHLYIGDFLITKKI